jgi:hypothetical protein
MAARRRESPKPHPPYDGGMARQSRNLSCQHLAAHERTLVFFKSRILRGDGGSAAWLARAASSVKRRRGSPRAASSVTTATQRAAWLAKPHPSRRHWSGSPRVASHVTMAAQGRGSPQCEPIRSTSGAERSIRTPSDWAHTIHPIFNLWANSSTPAFFCS